MKFPVYLFFTLLSICFLMSCKQEVRSKNPEVVINDPVPETETEITTIDSTGIVLKLQGKWKEMEYPYRLAHFNNNTVKFTEEGIVEEPSYQVYKILSECPFKVNNLKNARTNDLFLVMENAGTCEIIEVSKDTLTLSGFSINTNRDYKIVYNKVD